MQVTNITIGADPELFIINTKTNKIVSAIGIIPGEKGKPYTKNMEPGGFGVEIDGILAEFNIPPCTTKDDFGYMQKFASLFDFSRDGKKIFLHYICAYVYAYEWVFISILGLKNGILKDLVLKIAKSG